MTILVIAEHDNAALNAATLNVVAAAKQIGGDIEVLVAGEACGAVADAAAKLMVLVRLLLLTTRLTNTRSLNLWAI